MRNPLRGLWNRGTSEPELPEAVREPGEPERRAFESSVLPNWPAEHLASPEAVSMHGAMRLTPVFAAARLLCSQMASTPVNQYRKDGEHSRKIPKSALFRQPAAPSRGS